MAEVNCDRVRHACDSSAMFAAPLVLAASTLRSQSDETITNSLGRYCVLAVLIVLAFILHRLLLPSRFWSSLCECVENVVSSFVDLFTSSRWRYQSRWRSSSAAATYTFRTPLRRDYSITSAVLLVVMVVESIALRATMLRRRKLSIQQLHQQRQQLADKPTEGDAELVAGCGRNRGCQFGLRQPASTTTDPDWSRSQQQRSWCG